MNAVQLQSSVEDRRRKRDVLPEHVIYRDTGCDLYPACLHCPLPRCRYEEPGGAGGMLRSSRDASIVRMSRRGDMSVDAIASAFGLSRRSVFRVLERTRAAC